MASIPSDYRGVAIITEDVDLFHSKIPAGTICVCRPLYKNVQTSDPTRLSSLDPLGTGRSVDEEGKRVFGGVPCDWFHVMYYDAPTQPNGIGTRYDGHCTERFADIKGDILSPFKEASVDDRYMQEFLQFKEMKD